MRWYDVSFQYSTPLVRSKTSPNRNKTFRFETKLTAMYDETCFVSKGIANIRLVSFRVLNIRRGQKINKRVLVKNYCSWGQEFLNNINKTATSVFRDTMSTCFAKRRPLCHLSHCEHCFGHGFGGLKRLVTRRSLLENRRQADNRSKSYLLAPYGKRRRV